MTHLPMPEFAENPEPRAAIVILMDQSPSMQGRKLTQAQTGLHLFLQNLREDSLASKRAEIAILGFAGQVYSHTDFSTPHDITEPTLQILGGGTAIAGAVHAAIDLIDTRKEDYRANGVAYYRPWIVLITDGEPTEPAPAVHTAAQRARTLEEQNKVVFLSIGVDGADMTALAQFSTRAPLALRSVENFREFFLWLSASIRAVSQSRVGDRVNLPGRDDWASI